MNYYEIPFAVETEISIQGIEKSEGLNAMKEKIMSILAQNAGKIIKCEYIGVKKLAYKVKNFSDARFYILTVEAEAEFPAKLTQYFRLIDFLLRYQVYKLDAVQEKNSELLENAKKSTEYLKSEEEKLYANLFPVQASSTN